MTTAEFEKLMMDIDQELRDLDVPVFARPLRAAQIAAVRLGVEVIFGPLPGPAVPGVYEGWSLGAHIKEWFDRRYGDRLIMRPSPAFTAAFLVGDPWKVRIPYMFGGARFYADRSTVASTVPPGIPLRGPININVFAYVENLTLLTAQAATDAELDALVSHFIVALRTSHTLFDIREVSYVRELLADLDASALQLFSQPGQCGSSRWSSLQAAEKILKAFIQEKGSKVEKIHRIDDLARQALRLGLDTWGSSWTQTLSCAASVRYGEEPSTVLQAIAAHQTAFLVVDSVSAAIRRGRMEMSTGTC